MLTRVQIVLYLSQMDGLIILASPFNSAGRYFGVRTMPAMMRLGPSTGAVIRPRFRAAQVHAVAISGEIVAVPAAFAIAELE